MIQTTNRFRVILLCLIASTSLFAQKKTAQNTTLERPKLVVGIVVDQMRWDYLYRYYNKYENGGINDYSKKVFRAKTP